MATIDGAGKSRMMQENLLPTKQKLVAQHTREDQNMSQNKQQKKSSTQADFSDLSPHDAVALIVNTAVVAKNSGHDIRVYQKTWNEIPGLLVWMPGHIMQNNTVVKAPDKDKAVVVEETETTSGE